MPTIDELHAFKIKPLWKQFWQESFAFWMICGYLFFLYFRPEGLVPAVKLLPFISIFIALSIVGIFFDKNKRWVSDPVNKWIIAFFITILFSSYTAYYPEISKASLKHIYVWVVAYFLIINIVNTKERFYIFLLIFCVSSFKMSLHGAMAWASRGFGFTSWGLSGPPGYFVNSGELSIQMLVFFPIGYYLYKALKDRVQLWERVVLALFFITPAMTILGASSRGAQLGLLAQCLVMFYRQIFRPKPLIFIALAAYLAITFLPEEQKQRFQSMGDDRTSEQRILYWKNGIEMIRDHPFLGVGHYNFRYYYDNYYSHDLLYSHAEMAHNIYIQVASEAGLIGLAIYLLIQSRFLRRPRKSIEYRNPYYQAIAAGIPIGIFGFVIAGQFVTVAYYPFMWIGLALYVSLQNSFRVVPSEAQRSK